MNVDGLTKSEREIFFAGASEEARLRKCRRRDLRELVEFCKALDDVLERRRNEGAPRLPYPEARRKVADVFFPEWGPKPGILGIVHNVIAHPLLVLCPPLGRWLHEITSEQVRASIGEDKW